MRYGGPGPRIRPRMETHGVHRVARVSCVSTSSTGYTSHERPTSSRAASAKADTSRARASMRDSRAVSSAFPALPI